MAPEAKAVSIRKEYVNVSMGMSDNYRLSIAEAESLANSLFDAIADLVNGETPVMREGP